MSSPRPRAQGTRRRKKEEKKRKKKDTKDRKKKDKKERKKEKRKKEKKKKEPDVERSVISGKPILKKLDKTDADLERDAKRQQLLAFLNDAY